MRSILTMLAFIGIFLLTGAPGPYVANQVSGSQFCSTTTCQNSVSFGHTFVDVAAADENATLRSCACFLEEGVSVNANGTNLAIVDNTGDVWNIGFYDSDDTLCRDDVPPTEYQWSALQVRRFNSDGTLDTGWNSTSVGRILNLPATTQNQFLVGAAVDSSRNLYIAVDQQVFGSTDVVKIQKWDSTGAVVTSFGASGIKTVAATDFSSLVDFPKRAFSLKVTKDAVAEKLLLIGASVQSTSPFTNSGAWVVRMSLSGAYDTTFGEYSGAEHWLKADFGDVSADNPAASAAAEFVGGTVLIGIARSGTAGIYLVKTGNASVSCTSPSTCENTSHGLTSIPLLSGENNFGISSMSFDATDSKVAVGLSGSVSTTREYQVLKLSASTEALDSTFNGSGYASPITTIQGASITVAQNFQLHVQDTPTGAVYLSTGMTDALSVPAKRGVILKLTSGGARDTTFGTASGELLLSSCTPISLTQFGTAIGGFTPVIAVSCLQYDDVDEFGSQYCGEP